MNTVRLRILSQSVMQFLFLAEGLLHPDEFAAHIVDIGHCFIILYLLILHYALQHVLLCVDLLETTGPSLQEMLDQTGAQSLSPCLTSIRGCKMSNFLFAALLWLKAAFMSD